MAEKKRIIECVPNFSEGRDAVIIKQIEEAISSVSEVKVLHVDSGYDANRTVITFAGSPEGVQEAAFRGIKKASELIDMQTQEGTHPRMGATDVLPIVPISNVSNEEAIAISYSLSRRVAEELSIPVYNYEYSAKRDERKRLEQIRKGEYEGLEEMMQLPEWQADYGQHFNAKAGSTVIGARPFLLAYNINLATRDLLLAKDIASTIRESGKIIEGERKGGLFKGLKAIGWDVPEYDMVQVSTNITNTEELGMHHVYEAVKALAAQSGVDIAGSELIGLCPQRCILESGAYYAGDSASEEEKIKSAVTHLGLDSVVAFDPQKRIIEYQLK